MRVIWYTQNVRRDDSPTHITVTQESFHYECFTSTETVRIIRDGVYTPAAHSLFNVCTETDVLIYRSAHSLFSVCTETDVLIYRSAHSLFNASTETGVLIYMSVCPLSVQCVHRDGCVNLQVCMPTLCSVCAQRRMC